MKERLNTAYLDPHEWVTFTRRTNYPKLGYLISRLNDKQIPCRLNGESFHAPVLQVERCYESDAWEILSERHGRRQLDDIEDDDKMFENFGNVEPAEII